MMWEDEGKKEDPPNPLKIAWYVLTTTASVASLSNMVKDLVQWKGLIGELLDAYGRLIYPIYRFLLKWLSFNVPEPVLDYCTIGIIVGAGIVRTSLKSANISSDSVGTRIVKVVGMFLTVGVATILFWPVALLIATRSVLGVEMMKRSESVYFLSWVTAIFLLFLLLLLINAALVK